MFILGGSGTDGRSQADPMLAKIIGVAVRLNWHMRASAWWEGSVSVMFLTGRSGAGPFPVRPRLGSVPVVVPVVQQRVCTRKQQCSS